MARETCEQSFHLCSTFWRPRTFISVTFTGCQWSRDITLKSKIISSKTPTSRRTSQKSCKGLLLEGKTLEQWGTAKPENESCSESAKLTGAGFTIGVFWLMCQKSTIVLELWHVDKSLFQVDSPVCGKVWAPTADSPCMVYTASCFHRLCKSLISLRLLDLSQTCTKTDKRLSRLHLPISVDLKAL